MKHFVSRATNGAAVFAFVLLLPSVAQTAACGGDVSIGKTKDGLGTGPLKEGDTCPASSCEGQIVGGVRAPGTPPQTCTTLRCAAGPQEGSGVGVCHLVPDCLSEGDLCPAEKCANQQIACGPSADGTPQRTTNVRCVAGPQEGSGVGVCRLAADCVL